MKQRIPNLNDYIFEQEELNEGAEWLEVAKSIIAGYAISGIGKWYWTTGQNLFSNFIDAVSKHIENNKIKKDNEKIMAAAVSVAKKFENDKELEVLLKDLSKFPYIHMHTVSGKKEELAKTNNKERTKLLSKLNTYITSKLSPDEMKYIKDIKEYVKNIPLITNAGENLE